MPATGASSFVSVSAGSTLEVCVLAKNIRFRFRRASMLGLAALLALAAVTASGGVALAKRPVPPPTSSQTCTLTSAGVGQPMYLTGGGFAPDSQYIVYMSTPAGTGATTVNTDSSGNLANGNFWTTWAGTYDAQIYTEGHRPSLVASCS